MESEAGECGVKIGDEHTTEAGYLTLVPAARFANLRACLGSKRNARHA